MPGLRFYVGLFNIFTMIPGIMLFTLAVIAMSDPYIVLNLAKLWGNRDSIPIADIIYKSRYMILTSSFVILTPPLVAIVGLYFYSKLFVFLYGCIMLSVVIFLSVILVFGVMIPTQLGPQLDLLMKKSLKYYKGDDGLAVDLSPMEESVTFLWNLAHVKLRCCGFYNHTDFYYSRNVKWFGQEMGVPKTCCKKYSNSYLKKHDYGSLDRCRSPYLELPFINYLSCSKALRRAIFLRRNTFMLTLLFVITTQIFMICLLFLMVMPTESTFLEMINRW